MTLAVCCSALSISLVFNSAGASSLSLLLFVSPLSLARALRLLLLLSGTLAFVCVLRFVSCVQPRVVYLRAAVLEKELLER